MPRKVLTRRQRIAAECGEARRKIELQKLKLKGETLLTMCNNGPRSEPTVQGVADSAKNEPEKTTDRTIVNDKNLSTDKKMIDKLVDKFINEKTIRIFQGLQAASGQHIEQGSFRKSLTRRAAATITQMKKMSKTFNKKPSVIDLKNSLSGPPSDKNRPCNCNFCNQVLNQLLFNTKNCKNPRCQTNQRGTESPGHQDLQEICKECIDQEDRRRFWELMNLNEQEVNRRVRKKIQELTKKKSGKKLKVNKREPEPEPKPNIRESINEDIQAFQLRLSTSPKAAENKMCMKMPLGSKCTTILKSSVTAERIRSELKPKQVTSNKENFFSVMQQLTVPSAWIAPFQVQVLGNTGYFVLTGTNAQLQTQLEELKKGNIIVQKCFLLTDDDLPQLTEKAEEQLEQVHQDHKEILKQMGDIHDLVEPRRKKRQKKQRQCPKL